MPDTTSMASPARGAMTCVMGTIAALTCPCHLPILMALLSGTAAGAFLADNLVLAAVLFLAVFLLSAAATWRLAARNAE